MKLHPALLTLMILSWGSNASALAEDALVPDDCRKIIQVTPFEPELPEIPFPVPQAYSDVFKLPKPANTFQSMFLKDGFLNLGALSLDSGNQLMLSFEVPTLQGPKIAGLSFSSVNTRELGPLHRLTIQRPDQDISEISRLSFLKLFSSQDIRTFREGSYGADRFSGVVLQVQLLDRRPELIWVFDMSKKRIPDLPSYMRNLDSDYLDFVMRQYEIRLKMGRSELERLRAISAEAMDRTLLTLATDQELMHFGSEGGWGSEVYSAAVPDHLPISAGVSVVFSKSPEEPLFLEETTGYRIPRKSGETLAEVGRFAVSKSRVRPLSEELILQVASVMKGTQGVDRLLIKADLAHSKIYRKLGFRSIHEYTDPQGRSGFVLEAHTSDLFAIAVGRRFKKGDDFFDLVR